MDRRDFFYKQRVTEGELDGAFNDVERAMWDFAIDTRLFGIFDGAVPAPDGGRRITLTGPVNAYDRLGRRIHIGETEIEVDLDLDDNGVSTKILGGNTNTRWVSVFLIFDRHLDDPRVDGLGQEVYFLREEHYQISIRQGSEAPGTHNLRPALDDEGVLVGDFKIEKGDFNDETLEWVYQLDEDAIDLSRRQDFVVYDPVHIGIDLEAAEGWDWLPNAEGTTLQDVLDTIDDHAGGGAGRHRTDAIDWTAGSSSLMSNDQTLEEALLELDDKLGGNSGVSGDAYIGASAQSPPDVPHTLAAGTVRSQIGLLLGYLNSHLEDPTAAHNATAVNGVTVTTGSLSLSGANLALYLTNLQSWIYNNVARRLAAATSVTVNAGASATAINNIATAPTSIRVSVQEPGWGSDEWLYQGDEPSGGGWKFEDVAVEVVESGAAWDVNVKNNSAFQLKIRVEPFRVA